MRRQPSLHASRLSYFLLSHPRMHGCLQWSRCPKVHLHIYRTGGGDVQQERVVVSEKLMLAICPGLEQCSGLQCLEVQGNRLTSLAGLPPCLLLLHLDASHNQLTAFPPANLLSPLLTCLSLRSNQYSPLLQLPFLVYAFALPLSQCSRRSRYVYSCFFF